MSTYALKNCWNVMFLMMFLKIRKDLRGPGGLHRNSLEIDFIVVSVRGE